MSDLVLSELPGWSHAWSDEFEGAPGSPANPAAWRPEVGGHGWGNWDLAGVLVLGQDIDQVGWPRCGKIDVMENFGKDPTVVHGTVHGPGYAGPDGITAAFDAGIALADDFHTPSER